MVSRAKIHTQEGQGRKARSRPTVQHSARQGERTGLAMLVQRARMSPASLNAGGVLQLQRAAGNRAVSEHVQEQQKSGSGLPGRLRSGLESLSGLSMDDVRVHYHSPSPARVHALAHTYGADIYVGPGQERHLPHEAWHVVQQKQGRVRPTTQVHGREANDDSALEREASVMGTKALRAATHSAPVEARPAAPANRAPVIQRVCDSCGNPFCNDGSLCGKSSQRKYLPGMHGFKGNEQKRLSSKFESMVSGKTHESEHTVGFEPINQTSGLKRGTKGRASDLENLAPAYQEVYESHRAHIGTGTRSTADKTGFTSDTYRAAQRSLIESGDVSSAVQLNQLGYAFDPAFRERAGTAKGKAARDSYNVMVGGMKKFTYAKGTEDVTVNVNPRQRAEMYLARIAAETGQWPTGEQMAKAKKIFGVT